MGVCCERVNLVEHMIFYCEKQCFFEKQTTHDELWCDKISLPSLSVAIPVKTKKESTL